MRGHAGGARRSRQALLQDYDDYYYSRSGQAPLPVLRVKFADPLQTWLYIDPRTSQVRGAIAPLQPGGTLALQRPAQPRLPLLVFEAAAVGYRDDHAAAGRARGQQPGLVLRHPAAGDLS